MICKYAEIFCWKNVSSFCSAKATHIFSAKNIRILYIESAKIVNEITLNELVKLTTLWTTGPRFSVKILEKDSQKHLQKCKLTQMPGNAEKKRAHILTEPLFNHMRTVYVITRLRKCVICSWHAQLASEADLIYLTIFRHFYTGDNFSWLPDCFTAHQLPSEKESALQKGGKAILTELSRLNVYQLPLISAISIYPECMFGCEQFPYGQRDVFRCGSYNIQWKHGLHQGAVVQSLL